MYSHTRRPLFGTNHIMNLSRQDRYLSCSRKQTPKPLLLEVFLKCSVIVIICRLLPNSVMCCRTVQRIPTVHRRLSSHLCHQYSSSGRECPDCSPNLEKEKLRNAKLII